jgi:methyltransferase (TIGR00027 family)
MTAAPVKKSKRSHTAEGAAAVRAAGHRDPDPRLRNPDHMAERFLGPLLWLRACWPPVRPLTVWTIQRLLPGFYRFVVARTKHFDATLLTEVHNGVRQVVVLGAGADSRAYRFVRELADVSVYELDHPLTSVWKQKRVRKLFGHAPHHVRYVGVDFDHESLGTALDRAGVDRARPAVFLWEGVTHYLTASAVDATLAEIATFPPGSSVVFDYFYGEAFAEPPIYPDINRYRAYTAKRGELIVFGIDRRRVAEFVAKHGLQVVSDLGPEELSGRYTDGDPRMLEFSSIVHARVPR